MKYLIIVLMGFGSFQSFSRDCDITNYRDFVFNEKAMNKLLKEKKKGCDLQGAYLYKADLKEAYLREAYLRGYFKRS